jgi:hypothetical protein
MNLPMISWKERYIARWKEVSTLINQKGILQYEKLSHGVMKEVLS